MKILKYIVILFLFVVFSSFYKNEPNVSEFLYQKWVYESYENDKMTFESKRRFQKRKLGIEFKENGIIGLKTSSGWCGTEIDYLVISGNWKKISESLLEIEYKNWNGLNKDTLKIVELTKSKLILKPIYTLKTE